ncbi:MAG: ABC transporter permease [Anaerolineae bacterium]|nr:ABC transporter permease [Anaerolineae bacterium]
MIQLIPTIFGIYTFTFFLMRVLPGDPATILVGFRDDEQALVRLRSSMHLDEPLLNQYVAFLQNGIRGDLGQSYLTGQPVSEMIGEAFMPTVWLAVAAMALSVGIGVPLGILSALRKNSIWDHLSRFVSLIGVSIPVFWLGMQLQILFGLQLKWLPISGSGIDNHLILPAIALCGGTLALLTRMTRSSTLEELGQDYVRTAYSKGLKTRVVVWGHALRNALLPLVTVWGGSLANLLSGALLVELIFSWPGMGRLLIQAITTRDYPLLQGVVIVLALLYAGVNLLIDLSYPFIDPRIRYS